MTWVYAAVVSASFKFGKSFQIGKWILIPEFSNIDWRSDDDGRYMELYTIVLESKIIDKLQKKGESIRNNDIKRGECMTEIFEIAKSMISEHPDNVLCVGENALDLVNKAAVIGWETTGQVPGYPGPTGVTMMRRRVE